MTAAESSMSTNHLNNRLAAKGFSLNEDHLSIGKDAGISIHLQHVTKRFAQGPAVLDQLNLTIHKGEFVAVVGRSGCGKSTLLRLIAGLDEISSGTLLRDGEPVNGIGPSTRVMFQDSRLLPWLTVLDNVKLGVQSMNKNEAEAKAREALYQVGLEERAIDWPAVLSGGQKQRAALARALVSDPRLLLLDEPLGALDAFTRIEMQRLLEELWLQRGFTALLVTHDVSEAVALADRVILIEQGTVALDLAVTLTRPRERDSGFSYFENRILDRILNPSTRGKSTSARSLQYQI